MGQGKKECRHSGNVEYKCMRIGAQWYRCIVVKGCRGTEVQREVQLYRGTEGTGVRKDRGTVVVRYLRRYRLRKKQKKKSKEDKEGQREEKGGQRMLKRRERRTKNTKEKRT